MEAFKKEIIPLKDKLFRLAKTMLQNREDAEDAIQEVYMKLWNNSEVIEELKSPEAYAMKVSFFMVFLRLLLIKFSLLKHLSPSTLLT